MGGATKRTVATVVVMASVPFLSLCATASVAAQPGPVEPKVIPKKDYAHEYYRSFKGKPDNTEALAFKGPDAQEQVKYEPGGLRITLPAGFPDQRPGTGLALVSP